MKKIYLSICAGLMLAGFQAMAGDPVAKRNATVTAHQAQMPQVQTSNHLRAGNCDSLANFEETDTLAYYTVDIAQGGGYVSGQNGYMDEAKADIFTTTNTGAQVTGALILFAYASAANQTDTFSVVVWDENDTLPGTPGAVIANEAYSYQGATDDALAEVFSEITFQNPATIDSIFFAGVKFGYTAGDTIALYTNTDGASIPATAWELWSGGTDWFNYGDSSSWLLNVSHIIIPIVCGGNVDVPSVDYDKQVAVYPTIASDVLNVAIAPKTSEAHILVMDVTGNIVIDRKVNAMSSHIHQVDLSDLSNGSYMVTISFEGYNSTKKIVVQK